MKEQYLLAEGQIPVALIAHLDTVAEEYYAQAPNKTVLYDRDEDTLHVIGGCTLDDRLGVYAIMQIVESDLRPHIIFTRGEEIGGVGAYELINDYDKLPFEVNFMIELDRKGYNDSVYYTCGNDDFMEFINSFGFKTREGSFTDCLILGEAYNIAAVNLSIGYYDEHTINECAHLLWTHETIGGVQQILSGDLRKFTYDKVLPKYLFPSNLFKKRY